LDAEIIAHLVGGTAGQSLVNGAWGVYVGIDSRGRKQLWVPENEFYRKLRRTIFDTSGLTSSLDAALMLFEKRPQVCSTDPKTVCIMALKARMS
jgi:hypothetical protein